MDKLCKEIVLKKFPPELYEVYAAYDGGDCYIVAIKKKNAKPPYMDPFYKVDKKRRVISGFLPHMEMELFQRARRFPVKF